MMQAKLARKTHISSLLAWMRMQSARAADLTIATNHTQRTLLESDDARRVTVVRNSPPRWFANHKPSPPAGRAKLVFLGEIGVQDRVERAIDILAELLKDRRVDAELLIIGDGPERRTVEQRAERLRVSDRVTITGWVPFEDVPILLASAHVGLDTAPPTDVNHGSTMVKILEYLAVGLPVVATALRETVVTGGDAITMVGEDTTEGFTSAILAVLESTDSWRATLIERALEVRSFCGLRRAKHSSTATAVSPETRCSSERYACRRPVYPPVPGEAAEGPARESWLRRTRYGAGRPRRRPSAMLMDA